MLHKSWPMSAQFKRDDGSFRESPFDVVLALYVAKGIGRSKLEFECELIFMPYEGSSEFKPVTLADAVAGNPVRQEKLRGSLIGINFLCPRCQSGLYVPTPDHPEPKTAPRKVIVHWDRLLKSENNGHLYPTFTVEGEPMVCDYLNSEIIGIDQPVVSKCGWRGRIEIGKVYDHSIVQGELHV